MGAGGGWREEGGRRRRPAPPGRLSRARSRRARSCRAGPAPRAPRAPVAPAPSAGPAGAAVTVAPAAGRGRVSEALPEAASNLPLACRPAEWKRRNMAAFACRSAPRPGSAASALGRRGLPLREPVHRRRGCGLAAVALAPPAPGRCRGARGAAAPSVPFPGLSLKRPLGPRFSRRNKTREIVGYDWRKSDCHRLGWGRVANRRNSPQSYWTWKSKSRGEKKK